MIVKICGITKIDDARAALDAGADWIGLNLVTGPRRVSIEQAVAILKVLENPAVAVALLRWDDDSLIREMIQPLRAAGVVRWQLYGQQAARGVAWLRDERMSSILVGSAVDATSLAGFLDSLSEDTEDQPDYLLLDAGTPDRLGGTGQTADWAAVAAARASRGGLSDSGLRKSRKGAGRAGPGWLLAGGLTPENVASAIAQVRPTGVDVSSGVEIAPGRKDPARVRAFVQAVRAADRVVDGPAPDA